VPAVTGDLTGRRWALLVVRESAARMRSTVLRGGLPEASGNAVSRRLKKLEASGGRAGWNSARRRANPNTSLRGKDVSCREHPLQLLRHHFDGSSVGYSSLRRPLSDFRLLRHARER
jgi:hypothetical protein